MTSSPVSGQLEISNDPDALAHRVAEWFADTVVATPGTVRVALSGGSTPKELYTLLGGEPFVGRIPWERLELFWGDERFVPHDDPASNYRMVREALLSRTPVPPDKIHPMPVEGAPADAAVRYETLLKRIYGADEFDPARPFFHVMLLGLGSDGHTASLIPGQPVLEERKRWVAAVTGGRAEIRITLTYPTIESSRIIAFLATGTEKAAAAAAVRAGDENLPAARIRPCGEVIWFLDRAAAGGA
ncbi:MAG TPA: 6-phosphogluconolactonase [Rhizomicrobium sp.]|jgi:6-phosphogluconolactonase|nr:6-phosphogluconolactonase [Rhizomicrobium sp.]